MSLSGGVIVIPRGTVCVQCMINGVLDTDAQFVLQGLDIDPTNGLTVDGVLVLFQTENVFVPNINTILRCFSSSGSTQALVVFVSKSYTSHDLAVLVLILALAVFQPPIITGESTVKEGGDLDMDCDASNSGPLPSVQWFNPWGVLVSNDRDLVIDDIQRDAAGVYTCTATSTDDGETLNSTATVSVQCECVGRGVILRLYIGGNLSTHV